MPDNDHSTEIAQSPELATRGALAISRTAVGTFTIAPQNMGELIEFAKLMSMSGQCVRPAFRGNPGSCLAVALQAFRCGGDPFAWANKAYIVNDQLAYEAQLIHALVNSSNVLQRRLRPVYEGDGQSRRCRIVGFVKGETEPLEYDSPTIGSITVKNSPLWKSDPDQQLFYFSSRAWARRHVPEILLGMYASDELETIDVTPTPAGEGAPAGRMTKLERFETRHGPSPAEPDDKPFFFTDSDGEVLEFSNPEWARASFGDALADVAFRGEDGISGLWESNGALLSALREHGHPELADGLSTYCGELLDRARAAAVPETATAAHRVGRLEAVAQAGGGMGVSPPAAPLAASTNSPAAQLTRKDDTIGLGGPAAAGGPAKDDPQLAPLIARGDEAAGRGTEALQSWWEHGLSAMQRGSLGARGRGVGPYLEAWKIAAAEVDAARKPAAEPSEPASPIPAPVTLPAASARPAAAPSAPDGDLLRGNDDTGPFAVTATTREPMGGSSDTTVAASVRSPAGPGPTATKPVSRSEPATAADRPNLAIAPTMRNGKPEWRAWTIALFLPLLRKFNDDVSDLAFFLGDNEDNITKAKSAGFKDEIEAAISAQYRVVDGEPR